MFLNISRSLNYTQVGAERSKELVLRIEQLEKGEFPKYVVRSREIKEECWPLMEEVRRLQHLVPPVMSDPGGYFTNLLAKKQTELKLKMYSADQPLNDFSRVKEETRKELLAITRPICTQVWNLLTDSVKRLNDFSSTRETRIYTEFRDLGGDTEKDVKVVVEESNRETIGKIKDILLKTRERFTGEGCEMSWCSIEKIMHELEKVENKIDKLDTQKMKEYHTDKSFRDMMEDKNTFYQNPTTGKFEKV